MRHNSREISEYLKLGLIQGVAAWSAYAVVEFLASSVLFRLGRPYARFTPWHWTLTGELVLAYLAAGAISGCLAGLVLYLLRNTKRMREALPAVVTEHAATLTLALAITVHAATQPAAPDIWWKLLAVPLVLTDVLLLALYSEVWSERVGLLSHPWVVSGLFLSGGQVAALQFMGVARQFGMAIQPWYFTLVGIQVLAAWAAAKYGRRWRLAWRPKQVFGLNWAAIGLAGSLLVVSFALGAVPVAQDPPHLAAAGTASRPNVILIVMDTVRADHLSAFGYERDTSPNLRKLAADATLYTQALSAADITLTSHASIMTGLYPSWHGAYCRPPESAFGHKIGNVPTMPELLAANGYRTLGVAANLYLRADFGLQRGFQQFRIPRPVPVLASESWYMLRNGMRRVIGLITDTAQFDRLYSRGDTVNGELYDLLGQPRAGEAPFFAFLNYMDAHFPYIPPQPFDRLFPGKDAHETQADLVVLERRTLVHGDPVSPLYRRHSISQYDGGIAFADAQIGRLVGWLKRENLYDNTLLVVTADHGESFGERGLFEHGNSLYNNLLHVGLIVKYPHSAHTGKVETPVSLIDILPTVLNVAGVAVPGELQGRDLLSAGSGDPRKLFSESFPCPVSHGPECPDGCLMRTVVSWPDKYIFSSNGKSEVYQLQQDPKESLNLFGSMSHASQALATELDAWMKSMPPNHAVMPHDVPQPGQPLQGTGRLPGSGPLASEH